MELYKDIGDLKRGVEEALQWTKDGSLKVTDAKLLRESVIDRLAYTCALTASEELKDVSAWLIRAAGLELGAIPSSIQSLYDAIGTGKLRNFTVPAVNIRGMTYDFSRTLIRKAMQRKVGAFLFEIAKSEIGYTAQKPMEYAAIIIAAAIKEGYTGPLFIQGDHFQYNAKKFAENREGEMKAIKDLTRDAVAAGFYNIDIDASTLVDLSKPTVREQQRNNFECTSEMTKFVRGLEPKGITVSVGGEIGEVGGKNSTVEEFREFMNGYRDLFGKEIRGISKISVQTGTTHGGVPLPDGTVAKVKLDFATLETISKCARSEYGLSGCVQHGASTLPETLFDKFPRTGTAEIHLATEFQNMIYENSAFPAELKEKIYAYLRKECASERKTGETDEQFYYKTRKKAFGPFKKEVWGLPDNVKKGISVALDAKFDSLFQKLGVIDTASIVGDCVKPIKANRQMPKTLYT